MTELADLTLVEAADAVRDGQATRWNCWMRSGPTWTPSIRN